MEMDAPPKTTTTSPSAAATAAVKPRIRRNGSRSFGIIRSRSFSVCFKPAAVIDGESVDPTEFQIEPPPPKAVSFDVAKEEKNRGARRRLSRVIKAVLFETSLVKRAIKRKFKQRSASMEKIENHSEFLDHGESIEDEDMRTASYRSSGILSPFSSCLSERNFGAIREKGKGCFGSNAGLSLLVISMLILIFWGKICAIFCTSTWLFLIPQWSSKSRRSSSEKVEELSPDVYSGLYKKKVVLGGLLDRSRSHGPHD